MRQPDEGDHSLSKEVPDAGLERVGKRAYPVVVILSLLLGVTAVVRSAGSLTSITSSDLTDFFLKSADDVARGNPWHMYAIRSSSPYTTYPNVDPPLSIIAMAPWLWVGRALGVAHTYSAQVTLVSLPFVLLIPLLGSIIVAALRVKAPAVPPITRLLAFALLTLAPLTWVCVATWGHLEQPLMLCFLVTAVAALHLRHEALTGVLAGLAFLSGTAALFPLIALVASLVVQRLWRAVALVGGLATIVVALGLAPFLVVDRHDTVYSLLTWRGSEQIGGNSLWSVFTVDAVAHALPRSLDALLRRLDTPSMIALAVATAVRAARRLRVSAYGPEVWAVLAIAALGVPMLAKMMWPYYYFQPFVLLLIYECATASRRPAGLWRWPVLTVGFLVVATTLAQYVGLTSVGSLDRVVAGTLQSGVMILFARATWRHLRALT